jgi:hypothetical protein
MFVAQLQLSHFGAMVFFALLVSVALASAGRRAPLTRIKYALWCFLLFLAIGVGIAWLMYPLAR